MTGDVRHKAAGHAEDSVDPLPDGSAGAGRYAPAREGTGTNGCTESSLAAQNRAGQATEDAFGPCVGVSLLVEGGGMRGFYSAGVLECLRDEGLTFPLVIGVSSGALNAAAFVAGKLDLDFAGLTEKFGRSPFSLITPSGLVHPRSGLIKTDALIDLFCGDCWKGVQASPSRLLIPATDALTGELAWWGNDDFAAGPQALRACLAASASIPFVMPQARVGGRVYADGGIRDSIPLDRAEQAGYTRHVLLLTRPRGYVKGRQHLELCLRAWLHPYPALKRAMLARHINYNASARRAERLEGEGRAFMFRMGADAQVLGRFEYSPAKFEACYQAGYRAAQARMGELRAWLAGGEQRR